MTKESKTTSYQTPDKTSEVDIYRTPEMDKVEQCILSACMQSREALGKAVTQGIRPHMFYTEAHQLIFEAMTQLDINAKEIDLLTVSNYLREQKKLDEAGGYANLCNVYGTISTTAHIEDHCHILFEQYTRHAGVKSLSPLFVDLTSGACNVYDTLVQIHKLAGELMEHTPLECNLHTMPEVMAETLCRINERQRRAADGNLTGVPTGFDELDRLTGGWQPGNLIYLGGRPGEGKSAMTLHMARKAAEAGVNVLLYTLEMKAPELGERIALSASAVDKDRLKQGRLTPEEVQKLRDAAEQAETLPIRVDDTAYLSIDRLCSQAKLQHAKQPCGLVIVDYLQLLGASVTNRTREQEVAECSHKLKVLARALDVPVLVACQLNRQAVENSMEPELHNLRESGAIEQDADVVLMLDCPSRKWGGSNSLRPGKAKLHVRKQRNGDLGTVAYCHNSSMTSFRDATAE